MTNRDKLNELSKEEFARLLIMHSRECQMCVFKNDRADCLFNDCEDGIQKWLESEAEDDKQRED